MASIFSRIFGKAQVEDAINAYDDFEKKDPEAFEKAFKEKTHFIYESSPDSESCDYVYSIKDDVAVMYDKAMIQRIFENGALFEEMYDEAVNCQKHKKPCMISAYDMASHKVNEFPIAAIGVLGESMFSDSKNPEIQKRIQMLKKQMSPHKIENKQLLAIIQDADRLEALDVKKDEAILKQLSDIADELDDYMFEKSFYDDTIVGIADKVADFKQAHMNKMATENIENMLDTKSKVGANIRITKELHDDVLKSMPQEMDGHPITKAETAVYIYTRLCQMLTYDPVYAYNSNVGVQAHLNPIRLNSITPSNNNILCYEFAYLYSKFLEEFGIEHAIVYGNHLPSTLDIAEGHLSNEAQRASEGRMTNGGYLSNGHTYCIVKAEHLEGKEPVFIADSTNSQGWDLDRLKTSRIDPRQYCGIRPMENEKDKRSIQNVISSVATCVSTEHNPVPVSNLVEAYKNITGRENHISLPTQDRKEMLESIVHQTDFVNDALFYKNFRSVITRLGFNCEFLVSENRGIKEVNTVIEYGYEDGSKGYGLFSPNSDLEDVTREELREDIRGGRLLVDQKRFEKSKVLKEIIGTPEGKTQRICKGLR
ncbi:MAG: hypothetical protein IJ215_00120 [Clostridia bacterium]|nr:hypothetical protein [Clostridia bacterium]